MPLCWLNKASETQDLGLTGSTRAVRVLHSIVGDPTYRGHPELGGPDLLCSSNCCPENKHSSETYPALWDPHGDGSWRPLWATALQIPPSIKSLHWSQISGPQNIFSSQWEHSCSSPAATGPRCFVKYQSSSNPKAQLSFPYNLTTKGKVACFTLSHFSKSFSHSTSPSCVEKPAHGPVGLGKNPTEGSLHLLISLNHGTLPSCACSCTGQAGTLSSCRMNMEPHQGIKANSSALLVSEDSENSLESKAKQKEFLLSQVRPVDHPRTVIFLRNEFIVWQQASTFYLMCKMCISSACTSCFFPTLPSIISSCDLTRLYQRMRATGCVMTPVAPWRPRFPWERQRNKGDGRKADQPHTHYFFAMTFSNKNNSLKWLSFSTKDKTINQILPDKPFVGVMEIQGYCYTFSAVKDIWYRADIFYHSLNYTIPQWGEGSAGQVYMLEPHHATRSLVFFSSLDNSKPSPFWKSRF